MATIYKRNKVWHYRVIENGKKVTRTSRSTNKSQAQRMQAQDQLRADQGMQLDGGRNTVAPVVTGTPATLEGLLTAYISSKGKRGFDVERWEYCKRHVMRHLGNPQARSVNAEMVESFIETMLEESKPATVQTVFSFLRAAYNWAIRKKRLVHNPTKDIIVKGGSQPRNRFLSRQELDRLFLHLEGTTIREHVEISLLTGLRLGELQGMQERDVDFHGKAIWVPESKTGKPRSIPMHPDAERILWDRVQGIDTRKPFASPRNVGRPFRRALKRAGLSNIRWHDLRRGAASYLFMSGSDVKTVMQVLGWKDSRMALEVYAQVSPEHVREAVLRMPSFTNGTAKQPQPEGEPVAV